MQIDAQKGTIGCTIAGKKAYIWAYANIWALVKKCTNQIRKTVLCRLVCFIAICKYPL